MHGLVAHKRRAQASGISSLNLPLPVIAAAYYHRHGIGKGRDRWVLRLMGGASLLLHAYGLTCFEAMVKQRSVHVCKLGVFPSTLILFRAHVQSSTSLEEVSLRAEYPRPLGHAGRSVSGGVELPGGKGGEGREGGSDRIILEVVTQKRAP